jgi:hypothetical protein
MNIAARVYHSPAHRQTRSACPAHLKTMAKKMNDRPKIWFLRWKKLGSKKSKNYPKTNKIRILQTTKNLDDRPNFWSHGNWCDVVLRWVGI